jgi:hypothetical protein
VAAQGPARLSRERVIADLRRAAARGDRTALALALDQMRTLALSPRYWEKYLALLKHPLARLVDLLVLKQGDRIAHQKGWKLPGPAPKGVPALPAGGRSAGKRRARPATAPSAQPRLFD